MMRQFLAILCLSLVGGVMPDAAEAGGWGRGRWLAPRTVWRQPLPGYRDAVGYPDARYPTAEELYPKYYGGFHYRHLDNLGIPSGDIGIRGNGLYMSPW